MEVIIIILFFFFFLSFFSKHFNDIANKRKSRGTRDKLRQNISKELVVDESLIDLKESGKFMSAEDKAKYLKSKAWKVLKTLRKAVANYKCEACGVHEDDINETMNLHHEDYDNLGNEYLDDVKLLCPSCHNKIHEKLGYDRQTKYYIKDI